MDPSDIDRGGIFASFVTRTVGAPTARQPAAEAGDDDRLAHADAVPAISKVPATPTTVA